MIDVCAGQLRVAPMGGPFALDYGAVMQVGAAMGADAGLLADVLPAVEGFILAGLKGEDDDASETE